MNRSEEKGGDLHGREKEKPEQEEIKEGNDAEETRNLGDLLAVQMITMESCVNSLELFALKIPSNQKLKTTAQKFRSVLEEYKREGNSPASSPAPAPSTISNLRKMRDVKKDQEKPPKIKQLDAESSCQGENSMAGADENGSKSSGLPILEIRDFDFIQIPWNYDYDLDSKSEEAKIVVLEELKEYFSQFGEISNLLINNSVDLQLFSDLQILGEKVARVKINLATLESSSYAPVLEEILTKCPNLTFLDIEQKGEEKMDLEVKALFGLFLMKAVNQHQHQRQRQHQDEKDGREPLNFTISELAVDFTLYGNSKTFVYKRFAESGVQVKNLSLSHDVLLKFGPEVIQATTKIFHSSQNVMTQFSNETSYSQVWNEMKIPAMPNLHSLFISASVDDDTALFHPDFEFAKHAPNLKNLNLKLAGSKLFEQLWESTGQSLGPGPGPAMSVKTLHYSDSSRLYDIQVLLKLFPQLEELSLPWRRYSNTSSIFKFCKKLKTLTLFDVKLESKGSYMSVLAQLTGFRVEDVEKLWNQNQNSEETVDIDSKRFKQLGPSITALQDLEMLTLKRGENSWDDGSFESEFLSLFQKLTSDSMPKLGEVYL